MTDRSEVVLGIDIGATKLAVGTVRRDGEVIWHARRPSPSSHRDAVAELVRMGREAMQKAEADGLKVIATGIACGGPLDVEQGLVLSPPNLPDWDRVPLTRLMEEGFGVSAYLQNDAAAGAFATYLWDNPRGVADLVYMTVSSGVGSGVISNGQLLTGARGNGSELGHIPLVWNGRRCLCGLRGCVEAYVSGNSIGERFTQLHNAGHDSGQRFSAMDIADLARRGDPIAREFWDESMLMLRAAINAAINLYDPALITLGGGVTEAGDDLLAVILDLNQKGGALSGDLGRPVEVRRTGFGNKSGVTAAASIGWNAMAANNERHVRLRRLEAV